MDDALLQPAQAREAVAADRPAGARRRAARQRIARVAAKAAVAGKGPRAARTDSAGLAQRGSTRSAMSSANECPVYCIREVGAA